MTMMDGEFVKKKINLGPLRTFSVKLLTEWNNFMKFLASRETETENRNRLYNGKRLV